ncbi:MAG: cell division protein ZapA [Salinisphaera sp.]|nr:cell division protein ZapA [Salinisphaera sp.]
MHILGRDYQVACPEGEREALLMSGEYLSRRMTAVQKKGKTLGMERIAVMTALNMARDLLAGEDRRKRAPENGQVSERLEKLQSRIEETLERRR